MKEQKPNRRLLWNQLSALLHLWPAALTLALLLALLPTTRPVLAALPERLEPVAQEESVPEEPEAEELAQVVEGHYTDGIYTGSAQGYGGTIRVRVTVEGGSITCVEILSAAGETTGFLDRALGVVESVLTQQTWEVDVVSGATYSSQGILGAIQAALTGEQVETEAPRKEEPVTELVTDTYEAPQSGYQDGTYYGSATGFGGEIQVEVVISGGEIVSIRIVSAPGETSSFLKRAEVVIDRALASGSPNVDTVSGATYSSTGILNAVKRALAQAVVGETEDLTVVELPEELPEEPEPPAEEELPPAESTPEEPATPEEPVPSEPETPVIALYADGSYTARILCTDGEVFTYWLRVTVTVTDGSIAQVSVEKEEDTSEDPESNDLFLGYAMDGRTRGGVWYEGVCSQIVKAQSAERVDVVSGATYSSRAIAEAAGQALETAKEETAP